MATEYKEDYHQGYPCFADNCGFEPGIRHLKSIPTPQEIYRYALLGIPKFFQLTGEEIPMYLAEDALDSAIAEIEMSTGMNISEVVHYQPEDFIEGKFGMNAMGTKLIKWPATEIIKVALKFPNANTNTTYQEVVLPGTWIYLKKNKVNVTPAAGIASISVFANGGTPFNGVYSYSLGLNQPYSPGIIEIVYKAGFKADQLPANLADLIKTWAAGRMLTDLLPLLFPHSGVSVSIDGVNQSVQFNIAAMLTAKLQGLDLKKSQLLKSLMSQYKSVISTAFIGA